MRLHMATARRNLANANTSFKGQNISNDSCSYNIATTNEDRCYGINNTWSRGDKKGWSLFLRVRLCPTPTGTSVRQTRGRPPRRCRGRAVRSVSRCVAGSRILSSHKLAGAHAKDTPAWSVMRTALSSSLPGGLAGKSGYGNPFALMIQVVCECGAGSRKLQSLTRASTPIGGR